MRNYTTVLLVVSCILIASYEPFLKGFLAKKQTIPLDFEITNITKKSGIHFTHGFPKLPENSPYSNMEPWLSSHGASLAVVDINNDDWPDIYLTTSELNQPNQLLINNKDGSFTKDTNLGLSHINNNIGSVRPIFFDCDNDGTQELFLTRLGSCPHLFKKSTTGKYEMIPFPADPKSCSFATAVNVFDYNQSGNLSLILSTFIKDWHNALPNSIVNGKNGGQTFFYENQGSCNFKLKPDFIEAKEGLFTLSIGLGDFRNTGTTDIWLAADFVSAQLFTRNESSYTAYDGNFEKSLSHSAMNSAVGYIDNNPYPSIFNSQIFQRRFSIGGNTLWNFSQGKFKNKAREKNLFDCGWSWGGEFLDLDNNGELDYISANGLISANPDKDYFFNVGSMGSSIEELTSDISSWPPMEDASLFGHQRSCLFLNKGQNFINISEQVNFDNEKLDGRGVAIIDLMNNGSQSIVISHQKQKAQIYQVEQKNKHNWIGFKLIGTKNNRDGIGSKVTLTLSNGARLYRELFPMNSYSGQSDNRLHFGLGSHQASQAEIRWPDGFTQKVNVTQLNKYYKVVEQR